MKSHINQETCKWCHLCVEVCPNLIIEKDQAGHVQFNEEKTDFCIRCGQCMAVCNTRSVSVEGLNYDKEIFEVSPHKIGFDELHDFFATRRSIRNFKDKLVSDEFIQRIIDAVSMAPYGSPEDRVEITVVNNRTMIEQALPKMSEFYVKVGNWLTNPFMKFVIKKKLPSELFDTLHHHLLPNILRHHYDVKSGADHITRNAPCLLIFHANKNAGEHTEDSHIYATYAMLAAHSLGLGATMIGLVGPPINKFPELKKHFNIPEENEVVNSLIIGYPKFHYKYGIRRDRVKVNWM